MALPNGRIGFSSLNVLDRRKPKHQFQIPYEKTNTIIATDELYNDRFLLHSTFPAQSGDEFLQSVNGNEKSLFQQSNSIEQQTRGLVKGSLTSFVIVFLVSLEHVKKRPFKKQVFSFWDTTVKRYIYNLVTKEKFSDKLDLPTLLSTFELMKPHASLHRISTNAIPKIGSGLDQNT